MALNKKDYPRSIGELVRGQSETIHNKFGSNIFEMIQVTNTLTLTTIETYFNGMVGETICAYSYYLTDYSKGKPFVTEINTEEELRQVYKLVTGKRNRYRVWYFIKNFRGWCEDPRPYVI